MQKRSFFISIIVICLSLSGYFVFFWNSNPYPEVEWLEDYPGATDRYKTFTPVLKSNNNEILGPTLGADYAELIFSDIDEDGFDEVIIETDIGIDFGEFFTHEKHVLKSSIDSNGITRFRLTKSEIIGNSIRKTKHNKE